MYAKLNKQTLKLEKMNEFNNAKVMRIYCCSGMIGSDAKNRELRLRKNDISQSSLVIPWKSRENHVNSFFTSKS